MQHGHLRLCGRLKARRGLRNAIIAVATTILTAAYWMLRRGVVHADLDADHLDRTGRVRLARKLDELGFDVTPSRRKEA